MVQMGQFMPAHLSPLDSGTFWTHCSEAGSQSMEIQVPSVLFQSPRGPGDTAGGISGLAYIYTQACRGMEVHSACIGQNFLISQSYLPWVLVEVGMGLEWVAGVPNAGRLLARTTPEPAHLCWVLAWPWWP